MTANRWIVTRREVLKGSTVLLVTLGLLSLPSCARTTRPAPGTPTAPIRFGLITDIHHADLAPSGSRIYRDSLAKLAECIDRMNAERVDFLIELGDFKDKGPTEAVTLTWLDEVEHHFQRFYGPTYHVLGNHDMDAISKKQFLDRVTNTRILPGRSYYAFDRNGFHFIVLDANYDREGRDFDHGQFDYRDATVPPAELDWLAGDLAGGSGPVLVFIHQPLQGEQGMCVTNSAEVRTLLEASGRVLAVFQGHEHSGGIEKIEGITYYTLKGLIEGAAPDHNAYAIVEILPDTTLILTGYRQATPLTISPQVQTAD